MVCCVFLIVDGEDLFWVYFIWHWHNSCCRVKELRRLEFAVSTEPDTVLLFVRLSRRLKFLNIARSLWYLVYYWLVTPVLSAERTLWREAVLVFGNARSAVRSLLVVLSPSPPLLLSPSDLLFKDFVVPRLRLKDVNDWYPLFTFSFCFNKHSSQALLRNILFF